MSNELILAIRQKEKEINEAVKKLQDLKDSLDARRKSLDDWEKRLRYKELRIKKILEDRKIEGV